MNVRAATVVLCLIALATPVAAQRGPPRGRGGASRLELERNMQRRFNDVVRSRLGLQGDVAGSLVEVVSSFRAERQALLERQRALQQRIRMGAPGARRPRLQDIPDDEAPSILQEMIDLRSDELELFRHEQERLLEVLTPAQLVLYYVLREDLAARARGLRDGGPGPIRSGPGQGGSVPELGLGGPG